MRVILLMLLVLVAPAGIDSTEDKTGYASAPFGNMTTSVSIGMTSK